MDNAKSKDKLYYNQALLLIIGYRIMVGLSYMPAVDVKPGNQDVWIVLLLSIVYTIILNFPIIYLSNKFQNLNLLEFTEKIMGKFLGKVIGIFYFLVFLYANILFVGILVEVINATLFPVTPTGFTISIMLITCTYIGSKGIKNIGRLAEIIIPIVITSTFLLVLFGYKSYNLRELLPILSDSSFQEINIGAIEISLRFLDILALVMIIPNLENKKKINEIFIKSIVYSILIVMVFIVVTQITLGVEFTKHVNFPFFTYTRILTLRDIQGFDLLYMISWIMGNTLKISGYLYFASLTLGEVVNKKIKVLLFQYQL